VNVGAMFPPDEARALAELAKREHRSVAAQLRHLVSEGVHHEQRPR